MFIVVAIVIFGIFVGLTYTLFGSEGLSNGLKGLFEKSVEEVNVGRIEYEDTLKDRVQREIQSNDGTKYGIDRENRLENGREYTHTSLSDNATVDTFSIYTALKPESFTDTQWKGKYVEFSVTFRSDAVGHEMKYSYTMSVNGMDGRKELGRAVVTGDWQTLTVVVPDFEGDLELKGSKYGFLMLHMLHFSKEQFVDIQEFRVRTSINK